MKRISIFIVLALILVVSCKKNKSKVTPVCDGSAPTYTSFVSSFVQNNCASCHDYSTYAKLSTIINNGQFKTEVLDRQTMPQGTSASESDLNKLQCWVENGYPE